MKKVKMRDINIAMSATMELNLGTRSIKSKKIYNRKKFKQELRNY
jgi:hypothetical protein